MIPLRSPNCILYNLAIIPYNNNLKMIGDDSCKVDTNLFLMLR